MNGQVNVNTIIVRFYLLLLPFISLISIVLSGIRIAENNSYVQAFLIVLLSFDIFIVFSCTSVFKNKWVVLCAFLLFPSLSIGLVNFDLTRRVVTDFLIPFLFFSKVIVFSKYWSNDVFSDYVKYYSKITLLGSFLLIFFIYYLFSSSGISRLAIFPPLEMTMAYYMFSNLWLFPISLILIFLYGKRAQLVSAIIVIVIGGAFFKGGYKYLFWFGIALLFFLGGVFIIDNPDNLSVRRILYTLESIDFSSLSSINAVSAGRLDEVMAIIPHLDGLSFIFGNGNGFTYEIVLNSGEIKTASNSHFSPLGLFSKYGVVFTVFVYFFLFSVICKGAGNAKNNRLDLICFITALFVLLESFFSYAIFATSINAVVLGFILRGDNE
ncbi:hypothetical protein AB733_12425 [Photobacterium swingsii]|uniref:O-antigen ligase domain-containing protein n=1 Tax=Photobacterium swingsii TaxID=680026 RepID=A0A0J8VAU1_9GAMM|nr:hypothetical protein [Photobacterium swingsii]KMV30222.1 hypothetical protein AB733_12425 [Photobacterium swingsii]PSW23317.1 hypothetical protein C9I94_17005 [Photobacterium swingsii]